MKQKFEVLLLGDVWDFLDTLDEKIKNKILYNIDKSKYVNDPNFLKSLMTKSGSFVQNIGENIIDCLHFGIKQIMLKRLW